MFRNDWLLLCSNSGKISLLEPLLSISISDEAVLHKVSPAIFTFVDWGADRAYSSSMDFSCGVDAVTCVCFGLECMI
jgi:hypothetical protein